MSETPVPNAEAPSETSDFILTFTCDQQVGLLHAFTGVLANADGDIVELRQFDDTLERKFFLRIHFRVATADPEATEHALRGEFASLAEFFDGHYTLTAHGTRQRILVMASRSGHCLNDLLYRASLGELPLEIAAVVSNHPDHRERVEWYGLRFVHIPITPERKAEAEAELLSLVDELDIDLVVLARYMQILSPKLTEVLEGKVINIHHSFLPSFKGAKPYHQAYRRGVKTVGATAHYVNNELDEGPIIAQQVVQVDHTYGPEDLVASGRDSECKALADAVTWHCQQRVFLNGDRTVVLR